MIVTYSCTVKTASPVYLSIPYRQYPFLVLFLVTLMYTMYMPVLSYYILVCFLCLPLSPYPSPPTLLPPSLPFFCIGPPQKSLKTAHASILCPEHQGFTRHEVANLMQIAGAQFLANQCLLSNFHTMENKCYKSKHFCSTPLPLTTSTP